MVYVVFEIFWERKEKEKHCTKQRQERAETHIERGRERNLNNVSDKTENESLNSENLENGKIYNTSDST